LPTRKNIRNLELFFQQIDRGRSVIAWEPRGDDWTDELVRDICAANQLVHCVDPFVRDSAYGESIYWRLHGRAGYRYRYSESDLAELNAKLQVLPPLANSNYIMFNNMSSREDALRFSALPTRL
jgi:uncharacterized protein YecE (DUF72 family)